MVLHGLAWPCMGLHGFTWPCMALHGFSGLLWYCVAMSYCGIISPFLAVIDSNSFGLVSLKLATSLDLSAKYFTKHD